ncbi:MAG: glycosyltransferase family 4 protein [Tunicatimonas sp.]
MRILYFDFDIPYLVKDANYPVGGAAVEWLNWIKGFRANHHEVGVLSWRGASDFLGEQAKDFSVVETFGREEGIRYLRIFNLRLPRFIQAIRSYQPDVVIQGCASITTGLLSLAAQRAGVPFVYRAANDMDADDRHKSRLSFMEAYLYRSGLRNANAIVCQNSYQHQKFKEQFPDKSIIILHNPYQFGDRSAVKPLSQRKYIAWLGVFQPQKNLTALLDVVQSLPHYHFNIGGKLSKSHVDEATLQALERLREASNVTFEGYIKRTQIASFLSEAYLLLNTSHYEGFSNTFLEAFAAGTPIVTTRSVDPDHIIEQRKLGMVAEDHGGLAECVQQVVEHPEYEEMAQRCQQYVTESHDPQQLAAKFADFLAELN